MGSGDEPSTTLPPYMCTDFKIDHFDEPIQCQPICTTREICRSPSFCDSKSVMKEMNRNSLNEQQNNLDGLTSPSPQSVTLDSEVSNFTDTCIAQITSMTDAKNPKKVIEMYLASTSKSATISLECHYAVNAEYTWFVDDGDLLNGNELRREAGKNVTYSITLVSNDPDSWKQFLNEGFTFTCRASTKLPLVTETETQVTVKALRTIKYGGSQSFYCSPNVDGNFTWKVDGKISEGRNKNIEVLPFVYDHPKRVFVECDSNGKHLARFTMDVCAVEDKQQQLRLVVMCLIPAAFVILAISNVLLPWFLDGTMKARSMKTFLRNEDDDHDDERKEKKAEKIPEVQSKDIPKNGNKIRMPVVLCIQLLVLPVYSCFSYLADVATDYMAFFTYVATGQSNFGLATLALILLSALVTSTIAAINIFFSETVFKEDFKRLTKTKLRSCFTFVCMFCNFGPILIQIQLFLTNYEILKTVRIGKEASFEVRRRRERIIMLLMKLAISELVCESLGQGILQAYILSAQLGKDDVCLPTKDVMNVNMTENLINGWPSQNENFEAHYVQTGTISSDCSCELWVAKGAYHCYGSNFLEGSNQDEQVLSNLNCFIADCSTSKNTFSVIFPFVQVVSSIFQISFAMTHLGAVNNLKHVASFAKSAKKILFYVITLFYFLFSLVTSMVLSTYLASGDNGFMQLMAFLSVFRLILPEATPIRKYLAPWLVRVLTILLPLIAHLPFYFLLYSELSNDDSGCKELERNRITIHLRQDRTFERNIATYSVTADKIRPTLVEHVNSLGFFPISLDGLSKDFILPSNSNEAVFNIRNSFNFYGHFFLWTGSLIMTDLLLTIIFLCYWVFVIMPHRTVPNLDKIVDKLSGQMGLAFVNADSPVTLATSAGLTRKISVTSE